MLPPLTVAGCAAAFAAASLLAADTAVLRVLTVAAALTAGAGATLARSWDRSAGRRVAELITARTREEWRADECIAELETDLEESRDIRERLEKKLRAKRSELARLRTEHADLLRRYATAESERARALEARRKLRTEGAGQQLALSAGPSPVGPAAFLKAEQALRDLTRNGAKQQAQRTVDDARRREAAAPTEEEPQGKHAADGTAPAVPAAREHHLVPATAATTAKAVLPYAQPPQRTAPQHTPAHRAIGGFDFFGTQVPSVAPEAGKDHPDQTDEADEADRPDRAESAPASEEHAQAGEPASEVIDLTAHDDTEQLDMSGLRAQA